MCGRFGLIASGKQVALAFGAQEPLQILPRYNIAPTQAAWVIRSAQDAKGRALVQLNWGLLPAWAGRDAGGRPLINARVETVAQKPSFRDAYKHRRCVVPADGWYGLAHATHPPADPWGTAAASWTFDVWPVGRDVNRVSTDGPVCREPVDLSSMERQLPLL